MEISGFASQHQCFSWLFILSLTAVGIQIKIWSLKLNSTDFLGKGCFVSLLTFFPSTSPNSSLLISASGNEKAWLFDVICDHLHSARLTTWFQFPITHENITSQSEGIYSESCWINNWYKTSLRTHN